MNTQVYFVLSFFVSVCAVLPTNGAQYCVVGAGPGGIQIGHFFESSGRDYIIFEKNSTAGSFFRQYPRHRQLISINKRHTGSTNHEFNMRHDWNSLLSNNTKLELRHYTTKYFPHADDIVRYFEEYANEFNLNIQYNTEIKKIARDKVTQDFVLHDQNDQVYTCPVLIMGTGLWVPNIPDIVGAELTESYESVSINPEDFEGKTVLILGRGNAGFETASNIVGSTAYIHMASRSIIKLAFQTHYVGDLRAINDELVDTYQLKSLDGQTEIPGGSDDVKIIRAKGKYFIVPAGFEGEVPEQESELGFFFPYDVIIRCTGFLFDFSIFDISAHPEADGFTSKKFPRLKPNYEAEFQPGMFFVGVASHGVDYRKSAGGFIHGFRYTAKALYRHLENRYHANSWPSVTVPTSDLLNILIKRINEASGLYQMFGVLADVAIIRDNGQVLYLEEVPLHAIGNFKALTGHDPGRIIVLNFEYGKDYSGPGKDVLREDRATGNPIEADISNFLHPVLYHYAEIPHADEFVSKVGKVPKPTSYHHVVENFLTDWTSRKPHILPLRKFVESVVDADLREFSAEECLEAILMHGASNIPPSCEQQFLNGMSVSSIVNGGPGLYKKEQSS